MFAIEAREQGGKPRRPSGRHPHGEVFDAITVEVAADESGRRAGNARARGRHRTAQFDRPPPLFQNPDGAARDGGLCRAGDDDGSGRAGAPGEAADQPDDDNGVLEWSHLSILQAIGGKVNVNRAGMPEKTLEARIRSAIVYTGIRTFPSTGVLT
jgi:hypothetical protein